VNSLCDDGYTFRNANRNLIISVWQSVLTPLRVAMLSTKESPGPNGQMVLFTFGEILKSRTVQIIDILSNNVGLPTTDEETKAIYIKTLAGFQGHQVECLDQTEISDAQTNPARIASVQSIC
jgi:hypothetical protein